MTADFSPQFPPDSVPPAEARHLVTVHQTALDAAQSILSARGAVRIRYTQPQPRLTSLVPLRDRHLNYTAIVPLTEIPSAWHAGLRAYARRHEGRCYDRSATGYYLLPDWHRFLSDPTPETEVAACCKRGAGDRDSYPYLEWQNAELAPLSDYLEVLQALRFLACALPEGTLAWHKLAIFMRPAPN